jgi:hypothetical protein
MTREAWLLRAIDILGKEKFFPLGHKFNNIRVSVGFTSRKKAIGQWWEPKSTADNHSSIFIHPGRGDEVDILGILVHELCHDCLGAAEGHGRKFKKLATSLGLEGKMRATEVGKDLEKYLKTVSKRLGKFPHSALKQNASPVKKQTTRMVKMECETCGYICRAATTTIINHGPVLCPCNEEPMAVELPEEGE